jgi:hypothetical protein
MSKSLYRNIRPSTSIGKQQTNPNVQPPRVVRDERMYENLEDLHEATKEKDNKELQQQKELQAKSTPKGKSAGKGKSIGKGRSAARGKFSAKARNIATRAQSQSGPGSVGMGISSAIGAGMASTIIKNCGTGARWTVKRDLRKKINGWTPLTTNFFKDVAGECWEIVGYSNTNLGYKVYNDKFGAENWYPVTDGETYDTCTECTNTYTYYKRCSDNAEFAVASPLTGYATFFKNTSGVAYEIESYGNATDGGRTVQAAGTSNDITYSNCSDAQLEYDYLQIVTEKECETTDYAGTIGYVPSKGSYAAGQFYVVTNTKSGIYYAVRCVSIDNYTPGDYKSAPIGFENPTWESGGSDATSCQKAILRAEAENGGKKKK